MVTHKMRIAGYDYEVQVLDSTHFRYKIPELNDRWATPLHINQASDSQMVAFASACLLTRSGNYFIDYADGRV